MRGLLRGRGVARFVESPHTGGPSLQGGCAMGLLDQILASAGATGSQPAGAQPAGASTATPAAAPPQQAHSMLQGAMALINSPQIGGLPGLMKLFQEKGLGHMIS